MNKTILAALIGAVATISAAIIGLNAGKSSEQKNIQNEIKEVMGDMVNIIGDDNEVTINDIKDLVEEYQNLQKQNKSLTDQNIKYFDDLTEVNAKIDELNSQINDTPVLHFDSVGLTIGTEDISVNKNNSMVIIDGREYISKEIVEKLLPNNQNITIKNDTLFVGKVIADKTNLFDKTEVGNIACYTHDSFTDSYNNLRYNSICFYNYSGTISYDVNREYSYLQFTISIRNDADMRGEGTIIVKADENVVYTTTEPLNRLTEPFSPTDPIPISNCKLVTIEYNTSMDNDCIISDAIVYN